MSASDAMMTGAAPPCSSEQRAPGASLEAIGTGRQAPSGTRARQVRLAQGAVQGDLEKLVELGYIQKRSPKTDGVIVYAAVARVA